VSVTLRRLIPLASLAVAVLAFAIVVTQGASGMRVTAVFQQAYGLVPGGQVMIAGVQAGTIDSVTLSSDGLPHVAMRLDSGVVLHRGVWAELREISNSGELNRYVLLADPGRGPVLPDGAVIPSTQTAEPVEIDQLLNTLDPRTRAAVRGVLASFDSSTVNLGAAFRAALRHSADAFDQTAGVLHEVTFDGHALRTLVGSGAEVWATLAAQRPALAATVEQLSELLSETAQHQRSLNTAIALLPAGLREPRLALDRLRQAVPTLNRFITAAAPAVDQLRPTAAELAPVLRAARPAVDELAALTRSAPAALHRLGPLLPALYSTLVRIEPVLRLAMPVLDLVRVYTPDIAGLIANWASTNSSYDASGHGARILGSSAPPPATSQSPASGAPGFIPPPFLRLPGAAGGDPWRGYAASFLAAAKDR
jgi:phospholipid/cholesterol/gamma-HCH transport system substrate-binding protein